MPTSWTLHAPRLLHTTRQRSRPPHRQRRQELVAHRRQPQRLQELVALRRQLQRLQQPLVQHQCRAATVGGDRLSGSCVCDVVPVLLLLYCYKPASRPGSCAPFNCVVH